MKAFIATILLCLTVVTCINPAFAQDRPNRCSNEIGEPFEWALEKEAELGIKPKATIEFTKERALAFYDFYNNLVPAQPPASIVRNVQHVMKAEARLFPDGAFVIIHFMDAEQCTLFHLRGRGPVIGEIYMNFLKYEAQKGKGQGA